MKVIHNFKTRQEALEYLKVRGWSVDCYDDLGVVKLKHPEFKQGRRIERDGLKWIITIVE